jgi:outer membrane protein OmpA-like peptidoglycan-associated protein
MKWLRFPLLFFLGVAPHFLFGEESSPIFLALQAGTGSAFSPSGFTDVHKDPVFIGGRLGYLISDRWSVGAQFSSYTVGSDTSPAQGVRMVPLTAWAQREFPWTRLWTPYVMAGLGISRNRADNYSSEVSNTGWTAGLSLGLKLNFSEMHDVSVEVGVRQFSRATADKKDLRLFDGAVVLRFFLPESWVPMKPNVEISDADLEIPLISLEPDVEVDPTLLAQEELNLLQKEIESKKTPAISFDQGSAILQTPSFEALDTLGAIFRRYPDVRVRIYGFVAEGDPIENGEALALARAQVVGTYVIQNFYLNESRFIFLGKPSALPPPPGGSSTPVSRRIEFEALPGR